MPTIVEVLDAALEVWSKPGGVIAMNYTVDKNGENARLGSPDVARACAIGGIEHAVWKLTDGRGISTVLTRSAATAETPEPLDPDDRYSLFRETMVVLNIAARKLYDDLGESDCAAEAALFAVEEDDFEYTDDNDESVERYRAALQERMLAIAEEAKKAAS